MVFKETAFRDGLLQFERLDHFVDVEAVIGILADVTHKGQDISLITADKPGVDHF